MKNNIDFYQHYAASDQHPKFKMLRVKYGWSGEGRFWALNNRIAISDDCCLDISKKYNKAAVASDLGLSKEEFAEFIEYLLNECELIKECDDGVITTDIVQENFIKVMSNRGKARERKQRWLEKVSKGSGEKQKGSGEQNNKVKESKVKESKVKESKVNKKTIQKKFTPSVENKYNAFEYFDFFWDKYNKKVDRKKCEKVFLKLKEKDVNKILETIENYILANNDQQYRKNPLTYLNGECWNDEIIFNISKNGKFKPMSEGDAWLEKKQKEEGLNGFQQN